MPNATHVTSPTPIQTTPWLNVVQAARYCGCSDDTLRRAVARGTLHAVRVDGRRLLRFRATWLDNWLEAGQVTHQNETPGAVGRNPAHDGERQC